MASGTLSPPPVVSKSRGKVLAPADRDRFIEKQIGRTRAYVKSVDITYGLLVLVTGLLGYLLVVAVLDHWIVPAGLGWFGRTLMFLMLLGAVGWHVTRAVAPLFLRSINPLYAAHTIEQVQPSFKNSLLNLLQLRQDRTAVSNAVYESVEEHAASRLAQVPIEAAVDRAPLIRLGYVMFAVVVAAAFYLILSPKSALQSAARVLAPWADIAAPTRVEIHDVRPGNAAVVRGTQLEISAEIRGLSEGEEARVVFAAAGGENSERSIPLYLPEGDYRHVAKLPPGDERFQQDIVYHIEAGDALSPEFRVAVEPTPMIEIVAVHYDFPDYTAPVLVDKKVENAGDVRAIEGTKITLHAKANQAIARAWIDFDCDGKLDDPMTVRADWAWITFTLAFKDREAQIPLHTSYRLKFHNPGGRDNPEPVHHAIEVVPDLGPEVMLVAPEAPVIEAAADEEVEFHATAHDADFKLSDVLFKYEGQPAKANPSEEKLLADDKSPWQGHFDVRWKRTPEKMGFSAGDVIRYWVEAVDNRTPLETANRAETKSGLIRVLPPKNPPQQKKNPNPDPQKEPQPKEKDQGGDADAAKDAQQQKNPDQKNDRGMDDAEKQPDERMQGEKGKDGDPKDDQEKQPGGNDGEKKNDGEGMQDGMKDKMPGAGANDGMGDMKEQSNQPNDMGGMNGGQGEGASGNGMKGGKKGTKAGEPGKNGTTAESPGDAANSTGQSDTPSNDSKGTREAGKEGSSQPPRLPDNEQAIKKLLDDAKKSGKPDPAANPPADGAEGAPGDATEGAAEKKPTPGAGTAGENNPPAEQEGAGGKTKMPGDATAQPEQGGDEEGAAKPMDMPGEADATKMKEEMGEGTGEMPQETTSDEKGKHGGPAKAEGHKKEPDKPKPNEGGPNGGLGDRSAGTKGKASDDKTGSAAPHGKNKTQPQEGAKKEGNDKKSEDGEGAKSPSISDVQPRDSTEGETKGDRPGAGEEGGGQGAKKEGRDNDGSTTSSESGAGASKESGDGDVGENAGDKKEAAGATGKAGEKRGDGSTAKKTDQPPGGEKGKPGQGTNPQGDKSAKEREKEKGAKDGTAGDDTGAGNQVKPGAGTGANNPSATETPPEQTVEQEDPADLQYARQATDLALDHLRDRMKQGTEKELLEKLGWTREDAEQFLSNWDKIKADAARPDANADAQKNLNDELKSLGLRSSKAKVHAGNAQKDNERKLNSGVQIPTPAEFRDRQRAYRAGTGGKAE